MCMERGEVQSCGMIPENAGTGGTPRAEQGLALGPTGAEMKVNAGISQFICWDGSIFQESRTIPGSPAQQCMGLTATGAARAELSSPNGQVWRILGWVWSWCSLSGIHRWLLAWQRLWDTDIALNKAQVISFCAG